MKSIQKIPVFSLFTFFALGVCSALATSNYEYKKDEYVTISNGISPDKKFSIKAHGEGDLGYDNFHLYLFASNKRIGPLTEIVEVLDTGAEAYAARWSEDSRTVMIIYRVDRHAPLKSITYTLTEKRAVPKTKKPVDVTSRTLEEHWRRFGSGYPGPDGSRKRN
jgi:hypothetical protein